MLITDVTQKGAKHAKFAIFMCQAVDDPFPRT